MGASTQSNRFVSEINVTPFVDVMLVLLIIFMVTAPMMTEGLEVELPQTQAVDTLPTGDDNVVLTVKADGIVYLNEHKTEVENLALALDAMVKKQNKNLFLKADKEVPYGVVVDIMGRIKAAGIEQMGIVAERIDTPIPETGGQPVSPSPAPRR